MRKKQELEPVVTVMSVYLRVGMIIAVLVIGYGIICPFLVNDAEADILVGLGYALSYSLPFVCLWILSPIFKYLKKRFVE